MTIKNRVARFIALGFDASTQNGRYVRVGCTQCEAAIIQGTACHEAGCPNQTHPCEECDAQVPRGRRLCASCAGEE